jgi:hypothetical protein
MTTQLPPARQLRPQLDVVDQREMIGHRIIVLRAVTRRR